MRILPVTALILLPALTAPAAPFELISITHEVGIAFDRYDDRPKLREDWVLVRSYTDIDSQTHSSRTFSAEANAPGPDWDWGLARVGLQGDVGFNYLQLDSSRFSLWGWSGDEINTWVDVSMAFELTEASAWNLSVSLESWDKSGVAPTITLWNSDGTELLYRPGYQLRNGLAYYDPAQWSSAGDSPTDPNYFHRINYISSQGELAAGTYLLKTRYDSFSGIDSEGWTEEKLRFEVNPTSTASVPDTASTAGLLLLGLAALVARRTLRQKRPSSAADL